MRMVVEAEVRRPKFARETAHAAAWLGFAVINVVTIWFARSGSLGSRLLLSGFELWQLTGIALAGYAVLRLLSKWRDRAVVGMLTALGVLVGATCIAPDFRSFAGRHEHPELWRWLGAGAGLLVPLAAVLGAMLARPRLRWLALVAAACALELNHHILLADYRGIHLLLAWTATTFATAALVGAPQPGFLTAAGGGRSGRALLALGAGSGAVSLASFVILPPSAVLVQAFRSEGSVLFPFLVALHGEDHRGAELAGASQLKVSEDFRKSREAAPPIPPSLPRLAPDRPLVIFVTIDAMRAELLTTQAWRQRLPRLSRLADESVHFTRARSPGATTSNSLGQLFASKYSAQLRWLAEKGRGANLLSDPTPRLSTLLGEQNFATAHLVVYPRLAGKNGIVGAFGREIALKAEVKGQRFALSDAVVRTALGVIDEQAQQPTFLYMHWLDAHDPYDAAGKDGSVFDRYLREVELCDKSLGMLLDELEQRQLSSRTVIILAADHGEGLGDHGIPHHGQSVYEALVRVPLLVRVPGVRPRRVDTPVTTLDIAPTLLDLLGIATPGQYMGQSLVGFLRGKTPHLTRPIALDETRLRIHGLILGRYKIIDDAKRHTVEIYDLEADPQEARNLYGSMPDKRDEHLLAVTRDFFAQRDVNANKDDLPPD